MPVLLDTQAFLWWANDDARLSPAAREAIQDAAPGFVSMASCWEMAIKVSVEKLRLPGPLHPFVLEQLRVNDFQLLHVDLDDVVRVSDLPFHHRDPFDRMLAAQALNDDLTVVSSDPVFKKYGVKRVW
jgi:PIN domain nuclease of toxin-antitoxin system